MSLKTNEFTVGLLATCIGLLVTTPTRADLVDYNNPGDLNTNFALNHDGAGNRYGEVNVGGIGNSGAVNSAGAIDAVHTTALYDQRNFSLAGSGNSVTLSQFVMRQNDAGFPFEFSFQQLGVLQTSNGRLGTNSGSDSYVSLRVMSDTNVNTGVFLQTEVRGSADTSRTQQNITNQSANLVAGNWYKFWASFENISPTQVLITGALEDWGADASSFQSTVLSLPISNSQSLVDLSGLSGNTVLGDTQVWGGWRGFNEGGAALFDNFSVVPEPTTLILMSIGGLMLLRRRRSA